MIIIKAGDCYRVFAVIIIKAGGCYRGFAASIIKVIKAKGGDYG